MTGSLFIFGLGYSANAFATQMLARGWQVSGSTRSEAKARALRKAGFDPVIYDVKASATIEAKLKQADAVLVSIAPDVNGAKPDVAFGGDVVLQDFGDIITTQLQHPWIGYLSTVGVYGNHDGAWVDETTQCRPVSKRSTARVAAENAWLEAAENAQLPLCVFRLSGIYGPGRNPLEKVARGAGRRIDKPGQVFNRIHVNDIATALASGIEKQASGIFNITDDEPAPPQDVVTYAAKLLDVAVPPLIPFEEADLSPMGRSFYGENKRVSNQKSKDVLGMQYEIPDYRAGMKRALADLRQGQ
ncbi:MAG: SDR family oxidoreductase [Hyphomicrobiales bacterium]